MIVVCVLLLIVAACILYFSLRFCSDVIKAKKETEKNLANKNYQSKILVMWMLLKQKGQRIGDYLHKEKLHTVAIYGFADLGKCLFNELEEQQVNLEYIIDRNSQNKISTIPVLNPDYELPNVDVIIITVLFDKNSIREKLIKKGFNKVVGLDDIIYNMMMSCEIEV